MYILGNTKATSLRGKFLARSLAIFLRSLMDADRTKLIEKIMEISALDPRQAISPLLYV